MALHSVGNDLLNDWDNWSRGAINYEAEACKKHWKSFRSVGGISIGTLGLLAKQNGWRVPLSWGERAAISNLVIHETVSHQPQYSSAESSDENFEELAQEV